jgi:lipoate-protein ligase A
MKQPTVNLKEEDKENGYRSGKWRYLEDDGCTASLGLATDECLAMGLSSKVDATHVLRLYTYGERCALVGKYQEVSSEINQEYCRAQGMTINRRPTGGGAIIMGRGQLGVAIAMPLSEDFSFLKLSMIFERYSRGLLLGMEKLGLNANLKPRNDLLLNGKKIVGMAFSTIGNAALFHASLLVDLDETALAGALRSHTPLKALTSVSRELGRAVSIEEVRQAVKEGYKEAFAVELTPETFDHAEMREIGLLEKVKYKNPVWIFGPESEFRNQGAGVRMKGALYSDY